MAKSGAQLKVVRDDEPPRRPTPVAYPQRRRKPVEIWAWFAYAIFVLFLVLVAYLGARPGGRGAVLAFRLGPGLLSLAAIGVLLLGTAWSVLNRPFLQRRRKRAFLCLLVVFGVTSYPFPYPSSHEDHPSLVKFRIPADGEWTVFWGGDTREHNRLAVFSPDQRWGMHLVVTRDGKSFDKNGYELSDYYCFDRPVLAPAAGTVVRVDEGHEDNEPGSPPRDRANPLGNLVVIEVADDEFVFLAHLKHRSIKVHVGDTVVSGQEIGRVGASGYSKITPEPHLAVHLQDTPDPLWGEARPWLFWGYFADSEPVESGLPRGGITNSGAFRGQRIQSRQ